MDARVLKNATIFKKYSIIEEGTIQIDGNEFTRERIVRPDAATVFIYNTDNETIVLTRQFRYAIHDRTDHPILETMAGKLNDENERPEVAAIRETEEECGYVIDEKDLVKISSFFASPGYTTEKFHLFYTEVTNAHKKTKGGGLDEENEYIEVVEISIAEFQQMVQKGEMADGKALMGWYWFLNNKIKK